ncbi:exotoxin [Serratia marcescens]|uniref:fimbrial protein n=1 Tax=Serratia sp. CY54781 TaxID=3383638 RepID=UPI003FA000BE|nr:exotoxin [Serratia marcescens]
MRQGNRLQRVLAGAALSMLAMSAQSATTVTVSVTVLAPLPCVINGSKPIIVDFGDEVMTTRIDGARYSRQVDYGLSCSGQARNSLRLQIAGDRAAFDGQLLKTSVTGLGIALRRGSSERIAVNSWQNFTYPVLPELWAIPVKQPGAQLPTGEFTASATMRVDYQ